MSYLYRLVLLIGLLASPLAYGQACKQAFKKAPKVSYKEAQEYAHRLGITSQKEWQSHEHPPNIPKAPGSYFAKQGKWQGWKAFLGTEKVSYEEASQYARRAGIKGVDAWHALKHPSNIPARPDGYYKAQGEWLGWPNFLGYQNPMKATYEEVQEYARRVGIKNAQDWSKHKHPYNIPTSLAYHFGKTKEWRGWSHFLGKRQTSFEQTQEYARRVGIKSGRDWRAHEHPPNIPKTPDYYFKQQWPGWQKFLGTEKVSYKEAQEYARTADIKTETEWQRHKLPSNIPRRPEEFYAVRGQWQGWRAFLGTEKVSFKQASKYAQKLGIKSQKDWNSSQASHSHT